MDKLPGSDISVNAVVIVDPLFSKLLLKDDSLLSSGREKMEDFLTKGRYEVLIEYEIFAFSSEIIEFLDNRAVILLLNNASADGNC